MADEELVDMLEELLAEVRAGRVVAVAYAGARRDGQTIHAAMGDKHQGLHLVGAASVLHGAMVQAALDEDDDEDDDEGPKTFVASA